MERKYLGENDRIWCQSEEEAKKVIEIYYALGYHWAGGNAKETYYRKDIVYSLFRAFIQYGTKDAAQQFNNRNIVSAKEFIKYYENMTINGVELKAGMVIETEKDCWVVFPTQKGLAVINYTYTTSRISSWDLIGDFIRQHKNEIKSIHDISNGGSLTDGEILWEKPQEVVLTMQEIADKFGINVEQLRIAEMEK